MAQADAWRERTASWSLDAILVSPMLRCIATAARALGACNCSRWEVCAAAREHWWVHKQNRGRLAADLLPDLADLPSHGLANATIVDAVGAPSEHWDPADEAKASKRSLGRRSAAATLALGEIAVAPRPRSTEGRPSRRQLMRRVARDALPGLLARHARRCGCGGAVGAEAAAGVGRVVARVGKGRIDVRQRDALWIRVLLTLIGRKGGCCAQAIKSSLTAATLLSCPVVIDCSCKLRCDQVLRGGVGPRRQLVRTWSRGCTR